MKRNLKKSLVATLLALGTLAPLAVPQQAQANVSHQHMIRGDFRWWSPTRVVYLGNRTISFNLNGGQANGHDFSPITERTDRAFRIPGVPTRADHNFAGWRVGSPTGPIGSSFTGLNSLEPVTLYAAWIPRGTPGTHVASGIIWPDGRVQNGTALTGLSNNTITAHVRTLQDGNIAVGSSSGTWSGIHFLANGQVQNAGTNPQGTVNVNGQIIQGATNILLPSGAPGLNGFQTAGSVLTTSPRVHRMPLGTAWSANVTYVQISPVRVNIMWVEAPGQNGLIRHYPNDGVSHWWPGVTAGNTQAARLAIPTAQPVRILMPGGRGGSTPGTQTVYPVQIAPGTVAMENGDIHQTGPGGELTIIHPDGSFTQDGHREMGLRPSDRGYFYFPDDYIRYRDEVLDEPLEIQVPILPRTILF